jgi:hypothetical protein
MITNAYIIFVDEPEWKIPLERLGVDGDNIKLDLKEIGGEGVDWIHLAQDRYQYPGVLKTVLHLHTV